MENVLWNNYIILDMYENNGGNDGHNYTILISQWKELR